MITRKELDLLIKSLPKGLDAEEWRVAACVATGVSYGKQLHEIVKQYSINASLAKKWWNTFNFNDFGAPEVKKEKKKGKSGSVIHSFISSRVGESITPNFIADECSLSLPTVYNYINANRSSFKKVSRGTYQILDEEEERKKAGK